MYIAVDGKKLIYSVGIKLNRCTLRHDIGIIERHNMIRDFPLMIDINRLMNGSPLIRYEKDGYARIRVMPRYGDADSLIWFEIEPCTIFHVINYFEDGDGVIIDTSCDFIQLLCI